MAMIGDDGTRDLPPNQAFPPFAALRAFDAVARLGGVRKAAEALSMDHAAVSRYLRAVEKWTGASLFSRAGRGLALTPEGWRYHAKLASAMDALAEATLGLMEQTGAGRLSIWCVPGLALEWLMPRLQGFGDANPAIRLDLRPTDLLPDFSRHEAAVALRYVSNYAPEEALPSEVRMLELVRSPLVAVASPDYLARAAPIGEPADLFRHPLIEDELSSAWRAWFAGLGLEDPRKASGPRFWHGHMAMDAARRGHGVLLATRFLAQADLLAGRLVQVIAPEMSARADVFGGYLLASREDAWDAPFVARFRDWLFASAREQEAAYDDVDPAVRPR